MESMPDHAQLDTADVAGVKLTILRNDSIQVGVAVEHGAHIFSFTDRRTGVDVLYKDPRGPADYQVGAWYELLPNAGAACELDGVSVPSHGDIQHQPWTLLDQRVDAGGASLQLQAHSDVASLRVDKTITLDPIRPRLTVAEILTNTGSADQPYLWGQHVTFGEPFLGPSTRITLPYVEVYERDGGHPSLGRLAPGARGRLDAMPGPDGKPVDLSRFPAAPAGEMLFSEPLTDRWFEVSNSELTFRLDWAGDAFPCLWVWMANDAVPDHRGRKITALAVEPQSSPTPGLANAIDAGDAPTLRPGQSITATMTATLRSA
jgi:galactose mutarotase-like enzyme